MLYWIILACLAVSAEAAAPVFQDSPITLYIGEKEVTNRLIHYVTVSDPDGGLVTCYIETDRVRSDSTPGNSANSCPHDNPCADGTEFTLRRNPKTGVHELDIAGMPPATKGFFANESLYEVPIVCADSNNKKTTETVMIDALVDQAVQWDTPLPSVVPVDAKTFGVNSLIETAEASNTLGVDMKYRLNGISPNLPGTDPYFEINQDTGEIINLKDFYSAIPLDYGQAIFLDVEATDVNDKLKIYGRVTVKLENQNIRPATYSLPLTDTLGEDTPVGSTLFSLDIVNPEPDQTVTTSWSCNPSSGDSLFTLDGSNNFILTSSLNYKTANFYRCEFRLNDGYHDSLRTYTYRLTVTPVVVNEPPKFDSTMYYATFKEGKAGSVSVDPMLRCTDSKSGVTYALEDTGNSSRFRINRNTGVLTLATDYDVDGASAMPITDVLTVLCIDAGDSSGKKLTATSQITVAINDANDNAPALQRYGYVWYSDSTMIPGITIIGTLAPTDTDSGSNAEMQCSAKSSSKLASYYTVTSSCNIFLKKPIDFEPGTPVRYEVLIKDIGSPALTSTATVDVIFKNLNVTTTTTTTIATTPYDFWDKDGSVALFALTVLGLAGLLGAGLYVCLRTWMYGSGSLCPRLSCLHYKNLSTKQITPITPPNTPPPREKTPVIRKSAHPQKTIVEVSEPQRVIVRRTIINPGLRTIAQPSVLPGGPQLNVPANHLTPDLYP